MDTNAILDLAHKAQDQVWVDKANETHRTGRLCQWVSTFHPKNLSCQLDGTFYNGSFNASIKIVFSDSTAWMVRFPRGGKIHHDLADEKVAMEVSALNIIHDKTTIPVPRVHAWGLAARNSLGLGPFIMMDFINGVSLSRVLQDLDSEHPRLMTDNIGDSDVEAIYRQMANFMLQLFNLDFDRIGSLPWPMADAWSTPAPRPLTLKAHSIFHDGGVNTFGDRSHGFVTTTEYFQYVIEQDIQQLLHQPNSGVGHYDAQNKYISFKALKSLVPDLVNAEYDTHKFKLICDDLGLGNLIIESWDSFKVVGVVDLEWSYTGPAQLFGSAPWWLLLDRPVNSAWDYEGDELPKAASRYFENLEVFMHILEEEEEKLLGNDNKELSRLVRWSHASGAMFLHMLISSGFNGNRSFPFMQLRQHIGDRWESLQDQFDDPEELRVFAQQKMRELDLYDKDLDKIEADERLMDSGKMTKEEFIAECLARTERCQI